MRDGCEASRGRGGRFRPSASAGSAGPAPACLPRYRPDPLAGRRSRVQPRAMVSGAPSGWLPISVTRARDGGEAVAARPPHRSGRRGSGADRSAGRRRRPAGPARVQRLRAVGKRGSRLARRRGLRPRGIRAGQGRWRRRIANDGSSTAPSTAAPIRSSCLTPARTSSRRVRGTSTAMTAASTSWASAYTSAPSAVGGASKIT